jgi:hypothetical protein
MPFEMGCRLSSGSRQIHCYVSDDIFRLLVQMSQEAGVSRSTMIRDLIHAGIVAATDSR